MARKPKAISPGNTEPKNGPVVRVGVARSERRRADKTLVAPDARQLTRLLLKKGVITEEDLRGL